MANDEGDLHFAERMTDLEALMWRLETIGPIYRSTMTLVVTLDRPAEPAEVVDRVESMTRRIPRLRSRIAAGPLAMVPPRWEPDVAFDLRHHLRRMAVPGYGHFADLMSAAEIVSLEPLDPSRPPWQVVFVDGLHGGGQGAVFRLHHSYTDGLGAIRLIGEMFDAQRRPPPAPDDRGRDVPSSAPVSGGDPTLWDDIAAEMSRTRELAGRALPWLSRAVRDGVFTPRERARSALELVGSAADQVHQAWPPGSPILGPRSGGLRLDALELSLPEMRRAATQAKATVNDVFLAGLLGGLARYHQKHGATAPSLRLAVPLSTRSAGAGFEMHNQLEAVLLRGPLGPADPVERTRLVHEVVVRARRQPYLGLVDGATALGVRIPGLPRVAARLLRGIDVVASNVPGPPVDLYLAGARVERMIPIGPRSGAALNLTLLSYGDKVDIGLNVDPAASPDFNVLEDCLRAGFEEVITA